MTVKEWIKSRHIYIHSAENVYGESIKHTKRGAARLLSDLGIDFDIEEGFFDGELRQAYNSSLNEGYISFSRLNNEIKNYRAKTEDCSSRLFITDKILEEKGGDLGNNFSGYASSVDGLALISVRDLQNPQHMEIIRALTRHELSHVFGLKRHHAERIMSIEGLCDQDIDERDLDARSRALLRLMNNQIIHDDDFEHEDCNMCSKITGNVTCEYCLFYMTWNMAKLSKESNLLLFKDLEKGPVWTKLNYGGCAFIVPAKRYAWGTIKNEFGLTTIPGRKVAQPSWEEESF